MYTESDIIEPNAMAGRGSGYTRVTTIHCMSYESIVASSNTSRALHSQHVAQLLLATIEEVVPMTSPATLSAMFTVVIKELNNWKKRIF